MAAWDANGLRQSDSAYLPQQAEIDRSFPISVIETVLLGHWRMIGLLRPVTRPPAAARRKTMNNTEASRVWKYLRRKPTYIEDWRMTGAVRAGGAGAVPAAGVDGGRPGGGRVGLAGVGEPG